VRARAAAGNVPVMMRYEVVLEMEAARSAGVAEYLRDIHIPAIFATGCFRSVRLERASPTRLRASYAAQRAGDLEGYLRDHAPALRAEFQTRFPVGVTAIRESWTEIAVWE
jgi:hypothetical protein